MVKKFPINMAELGSNFDHYAEWYQIVRSHLNSINSPVKVCNITMLEDPLPVVFNLHFEWAYYDMKKNWDDMGIHPCYFFYEDLDGYRASSDPTKEINHISISKSLIFAIHNRPAFYSKMMAGAPLLKGFIDDQSFIANPPMVMAKFAFCFLYYHELGHIMQNVDYREASSTRKTNLTPAQILEAHVVEIDADLFSSRFIVKHIVTQWQSIEARKRTISSLEAITAIALSTHFMLMETVHGGIRNVYLLEEDHPHEIIRISLMASQILEILLNHYRLKIDLSNVQKFFMAIIEATDLGASQKKYEAGLTGNFPGFANYLNIIRIETAKRPYLAVEKHRKIYEAKKAEQKGK